MRAVSLIGFGAIGARLARVLAEHGPGTVMGPVLLRQGSPRRELALAAGLTVVDDVAALVAAGPEIVVECAGQDALAAHGAQILSAGIDLVVASVGALAEPGMEALLRDAAGRGGAALTIPAGAIGGVDAVAAMRLAGLQRVAYRSRKPPAAWAGTPAAARVDLAALSREAVLYAGTAREAALRFPRNANVAATIGFAGLGLDRTEVELVADPQVTANVHEIEAHGATGSMSLRISGVPDPENPKTSALTAYSLARAVLNACESWRI